MVDIRTYRISAVMSVVFLILSLFLQLNTPEAKIHHVIEEYYDALMRLNFSAAIPLTTGKLRQNLVTYREDLEFAGQFAGYTGSLRDIRIRITDLRDNYAKADVTVLSYIKTVDIPHSTFERYFDVELALVEGEWKIVVSLQRTSRIYDLE